MSTCPVCGVMTSDPCGMGGQGTGPLPDSIGSFDKDRYSVQAYEFTSNNRPYHSYSVERKHVKCDVCTTLEQIAIHDPERAQKIVRAAEVRAAIEKSVTEHGDVWKALADM